MSDVSDMTISELVALAEKVRSAPAGIQVLGQRSRRRNKDGPIGGIRADSPYPLRSPYM